MVERIAASEAAHDEIVDWIRERTRKEGMSRAPSPETRRKDRKLRISARRAGPSETRCSPGISPLAAART
jgi:hypothetical protein